MTEKNIFAYKLVLSLNISDFNFFMWKLDPPPPEKSEPLFPSNPPLKAEALSSSPPIGKFGWGFTPPPPQHKGGGAHYGYDIKNCAQTGLWSIENKGIGTEWIKANRKH